MFWGCCIRVLVGKLLPFRADIYVFRFQQTGSDFSPSRTISSIMCEIMVREIAVDHTKVQRNSDNTFYMIVFLLPTDFLMIFAGRKMIKRLKGIMMSAK